MSTHGLHCTRNSLQPRQPKLNDNICIRVIRDEASWPASGKRTRKINTCVGKRHPSNLSSLHLHLRCTHWPFIHCALFSHFRIAAEDQIYRPVLRTKKPRTLLSVIVYPIILPWSFPEPYIHSKSSEPALHTPKAGQTQGAHSHLIITQSGVLDAIEANAEGRTTIHCLTIAVPCGTISSVCLPVLTGGNTDRRQVQALHT
ncbi:hypothetical protein B0T22DRAFT_154654 [Podospora appendiculata]|uniref:Uncharacterized protein n=1 Tax=Podospora appendiculata TaxID=314037 RepID=A0AAE0X9P8_9PEZI|nr:hypothetical protein B0T22DRAFT_154654 [Podospora appendiculata]